MILAMPDPSTTSPITAPPAASPPQASADTTCPACAHTGRAWLTLPDDWRRPGAGEWNLWWCDDCSYGWLNPRPDPAAIPAFYDVEYYTHEKESDDEAQRSLARKVVEHLAWRFDNETPFSPDWFSRWLPADDARAVDLGAGSGVYTQMLVGAGARVLAVETDPKARAVIEERGIDAVDGLCENLPDSVPRDSFDLALLSHVLEHTLRPDIALQQCASTLKKGGVLVVEVPNNEAAGLSRAGPCWHWLDVPRHLNFFTRPSLVAAIERAGLTIEHVEYRGYTRQFQQGWLEAEQKITGILQPGPTPRFATGLGQARLLARTALAPASRKYDSIRVVARR